MKSPWRSPLYAILDLPHAGGLDLVDAGRGLLAGGCGVLQVRAKAGFESVDGDALIELAHFTAAKGVPFIINDDSRLGVEISRLVPSAEIGVHLGQEDLVAFQALGGKRSEPSGYWGLSTHSLEQVAHAGPSSASYLGFGPVFATQTKAPADRVTGIALLAQACRSSSQPIVAIGGVDMERGSSCLEAGAAAVACVSALVADSRVRIEARCGEVLGALMMH